MQLPGNRPTRIAVLILGLIALASCSTLPTGPAPSAQQNTITRTGGDEDPTPTPKLGLVTAKVIDGRYGGTLYLGNWKLVIPKGAIAGVATITISVPDTTVDQCELAINPPSLNHFAQPVELRYRCVSISDALRRDMRWWNPTTNTWVVIESWANEDDLTRCAPLVHFSTYASGKAGW